METTMHPRVRLQLAVVIVLTILGGVYLVTQPDEPPLPEWCAYPEPEGVAALQAAVDERVKEIGYYSPGQPVDRFTLQLDLMTRCA